MYKALHLTDDIRGDFNKFPDFFVWAFLLIVHTWNSSPFRSTLLRLQCTCCTVPTTSGRPHGSPLVWTCQWPSSQPVSSPQFSHNDSSLNLGNKLNVTGSKVWALGRLRNCLDAHLSQIVCTRMELWTGALSCWKCHWPELKSAGPFQWNLFLNSLKTPTYYSLLTVCPVGTQCM